MLSLFLFSSAYAFTSYQEDRFNLSATEVCFITSQLGPAEHFSAIAEALLKKGHTVQIYATELVLKKFSHFDNKQITLIDLETSSIENRAMEVAKKCSKSAVVIIDIAPLFTVALQKALSEYAIETWIYYDNPEDLVLGGYSDTAAKTLPVSNRILFANANLATRPIYQTLYQEIFLDPKKKIGLGYYPIAQAEKIAQRRVSDRSKVREQFFSQFSLKDLDQKVLVYAGGNNTEYFTQAFPAFLQFLAGAASETDLSHYIILLQQHPGAKEKNLDLILLRQWLDQYGKNETAPKFYLSESNFEETQVLADGILYYQTSMGPQFVLAGIPTIQVGQSIYEDILVRNHLCSIATDVKELLVAFNQLTERKKQPLDKELIKKGLGIDSNWADRLESELF